MQASSRGGLAVALLTALAACGGPEPAAPPPRTSFEQLHYDYLNKLRLDVARVDINANWAPHDGARHVEGASPASPIQAMTAMAQERLLPAGSAGRAEFAIEDASLIRTADGYRGHFAARVTLTADDGRSLGSAEIQVSGVHPSTGSASADLLDLTRTLMDSLNVELEYQLQHVVRDRMLNTSETAPPPAAVQTQTLAPPPGAQSRPEGAPDDATPSAADVPAPTPLVAPAPMSAAPSDPQSTYTPLPMTPPTTSSPDAPAPPIMSPPPTFLDAPSRAPAPQMPPAPTLPGGPIPLTDPGS